MLLKKLLLNKKPLDILKEGTVIPATPLALDENRSFDEVMQRRLIRYYLSAGVGGIATAVHTTQFEIRLPQYNLYKTVLSVVIDEIKRFEQANNKTIVKIAGACGDSAQALKEAEYARKLGYDAVLLNPGGLKDKSEAYMLERTKEVSSIIPVIGFYLQPSVGGRIFSFDYWEKLCEIENVIAIKLAPFNRYQTLEAVRAAAFSSRDIALYTGNDDNIIIDLLNEYEFEKNGIIYKKKFVGGLLGHWAVWTNTAVKLFEKIKKEGLTPEMLILSNQITDCNSAFFDAANNFKGCIAGLHEVLRRQGLLKGIWCLNKEETLSEGQLEEIDRVYKMYPHLNDDEFVRRFLKGEKT
ncbi:MAG: dihydrodipicolinate synthase family protein [Clostridia bacterium]|nr:dihydrodipicolinate synthase family protein [Clostridia bacterium]